MSFLALQDVGFGYAGAAPVVRGVTLSLAAGELHCLVGRSGSGKTTLLKLAAGLLAPTAGTILLRGSAGIDPKQVGFMFQSPTLLEWLKVRDNVLLPISLQRRPTAADTQAVDALLARVGLPGLGDRLPHQLSGGQQSRVALARALVLAPPLLLLDEPFAALDALTREELQRDLSTLARTRGTTVLFVTHDVAEAVFLGDRVSVLAQGDLVRTIDTRDAGERDTPGFGQACASVRALLAQPRPAAEAVPA
ncbi:MAG: ABC transporter ATP-binding protein [Comamonadaceae bacterium]|nr:MAG: ABC transporter ATP-binding protein [Comamonadaceae bacterium]